MSSYVCVCAIDACSVACVGEDAPAEWFRLTDVCRGFGAMGRERPWDAGFMAEFCSVTRSRPCAMVIDDAPAGI